MDSNQPKVVPNRLPQIIVVIVAALVAVAITRRDSGVTPEPVRPAYEMIAYLDGRVGLQENQTSSNEISGLKTTVSNVCCSRGVNYFYLLN